MVVVGEPYLSIHFYGRANQTVLTKSEFWFFFFHSSTGCTCDVRVCEKHTKTGAGKVQRVILLHLDVTFCHMNHVSRAKNNRRKRISSTKMPQSAPSITSQRAFRKNNTKRSSNTLNSYQNQSFQQEHSKEDYNNERSTSEMADGSYHWQFQIW